MSSRPWSRRASRCASRPRWCRAWTWPGRRRARRSRGRRRARSCREPPDGDLVLARALHAVRRADVARTTGVERQDQVSAELAHLGVADRPGRRAPAGAVVTGPPAAAVVALVGAFA